MAGKYKFTVQEAQNISMGGVGNILVTGTNAVTCKNGVFIAIQVIEDCVFNSTDGLVAETTQTWLDDEGTSTNVSDSNGANTDSVTFPAGISLYGRWTGLKLASGKVVAYVG